MARTGIDFATLLGTVELTETVEPQESAEISRRTRIRSSNRSAASSALHSNESVESKDKNKSESVENVNQMESSSKGKVEGSLFANYFRSCENSIALVLVGILFVLAQVLASSADYWVSFW